jgi:hypothetical protein
MDDIMEQFLDRLLHRLDDPSLSENDKMLLRRQRDDWEERVDELTELLDDTEEEEVVITVRSAPKEVSKDDLLKVKRADHAVNKVIQRFGMDEQDFERVTRELEKAGVFCGSDRKLR